MISSQTNAHQTNVDQSRPATLLLVDDHPLLRKGLIQLVDMDDSLQVVAETDNGRDALTLALKHDPDLILLDLNMQGMDGLETLKAMREAQISARIIILTVSDNNEDVVCAITYGADGYLLKDMEPEDILKKIKQAAVGKMVISEKVTHILAGAIRKGDNQRSNMLARLTSRERDILKQIAKGLSNKLIARELNISDGTVKVHVKHILKKLELRSRVEAAVWMVNQAVSNQGSSNQNSSNQNSSSQNTASQSAVGQSTINQSTINQSTLAKKHD